MIENGDEKQVNPAIKEDGWEKSVIEKIALSAVNEQRTARRWSIFFKLLMFGYLIAVLLIATKPFSKQGLNVSDKHTAVINVAGTILEDSDANAKTIIEGLRNALKDEKTKGVILHMNTPGGSPVQSAYVYEEIIRLRKKYPKTPVHAVVSDICASGGYYIASAAEKIFVNEASIVGSIGVIMNGFGFVNTMEKFGIERRLLIAGDHKALLDPFSPEDKNEKEHFQKLLNQVHQQFINAVKQGRGDKLKETTETFTGLVWNGTESIRLGLADGLGNDDFVAREVIGADQIVDFTPQEPLLEKLSGQLGASFGTAFAKVISAMTNPKLL